jgi:glycosyltransferase involved in cell wall biosynthesis
MELARPIVATRAGGNIELIQDGENGLLVSVGDSEKLAELIIDLCTNKEKATTLGARARERSKEFSQEKMLDTTAHFFIGDRQAKTNFLEKELSEHGTPSQGPLTF